MKLSFLLTRTRVEYIIQFPKKQDFSVACSCQTSEVWLQGGCVLWCLLARNGVSSILGKRTPGYTLVCFHLGFLSRSLAVRLREDDVKVLWMHSTLAIGQTLLLLSRSVQSLCVGMCAGARAVLWSLRIQVLNCSLVMESQLKVLEVQWPWRKNQ